MCVPVILPEVHDMQIWHLSAQHYIVIYGLSGSIVFFHFVS